MAPFSEHHTEEQRRRYAISRLTNDFVRKDTHAAYLSAVLVERQRNLVAAFFTLLAILCTFLHGMVTLDRLRVPEGEVGFEESRAAFEVTIGLLVPLIVVTSGGLAAALVLVRESHEQRYSPTQGDPDALSTLGRGSVGTSISRGMPGDVAVDLEEAANRSSKAQGRDNVWRRLRCNRSYPPRRFAGFGALVVLLILLKVCYVATAIGLFFVTNADGWCLSFTLCASAFHSFGNGLMVKHNNLAILTVFVLVVRYARKQENTFYR